MLVSVVLGQLTVTCVIVPFWTSIEKMKKVHEMIVLSQLHFGFELNFLLYLSTALVVRKAMREDRSKAMAIFGKHDYLLRFWNELTPEERQQLVDQFTLYNMHEIDKAFKESAIPMVCQWFVML